MGKSHLSPKHTTPKAIGEDAVYTKNVPKMCMDDNHWFISYNQTTTHMHLSKLVTAIDSLTVSPTCNPVALIN